MNWPSVDYFEGLVIDVPDDVAGHLAAGGIETGHEPQQIHGDEPLTTDLQTDLSLAGVDLAWPQNRAY
ncbi:hypothetical protein OCAE111667_03905 [Occultella aeris]|uniref:Uncharacterized protein n=1 Tax=Occultella aeris TaxID=2761496 RepID=A0A7M4DDR2_9MICO|nr:hypothetical protein HALOF300_00251 [Occultella aeris]